MKLIGYVEVEIVEEIVHGEVTTSWTITATTSTKLAIELEYLDGKLLSM